MMAQNWAQHRRGGALAVAAVMAVALACAVTVEAQTAKKAAAKQKVPEAATQDGEQKAADKKKKVTPAEAQQAVDAAVKLLETGKAEQASQALTNTLAAGRLPPPIMAKALLYRGMAYRQLKKPAQAVGDLTSALWLKGGLSESERKDALAQRTAAYQEAGLTESGEPVAAAVPQATRTAARSAQPEPGTSAPSVAWGPDSQPAPPAAREPRASTSTNTSLAPAPEPASPPPAEKQSGGGLWNPFSGIFNTGNATQPSAPPAAAPPSSPAAASVFGEPKPVVPYAGAPREKRTTAWSSQTETKPGAPAPPPAVTPAAARVETAALPKADGKFRVQVGMVRTQDQAQMLVGKVKTQYAAAFGSREPQIDQAVVGNMGSFYRVRVGPFASQQEGQAACAKLKGSGLDCLVVAQ